MASFRRFEDTESWQKARQLTQTIYRTTQAEPFKRDFALRDQIRRASVSIMSNIAEGFDRRRNQASLQFLSVARGSAAEVRSQPYVTFDAGYIEEGRFDTLKEQSEEISRLIGGLMRHLKNSYKGPKYR